MNNLLELLGKDTLPKPLVSAFVNWCVWAQALPALLTVLQETGFVSLSKELQRARNLYLLAETSDKIGHLVEENVTRSGPFNLYAAKASAFLLSQVANAAQEKNWDPEGVTFFASQICGWAAFAKSGFKHPAEKMRAETVARADQVNQFQSLWEEFAGAMAE